MRSRSLLSRADWAAFSARYSASTERARPTSASSAGPPQASTILINASAASALSSSTCSLGNALLARGMVHDIMSRAASAMVLPLASNASMASSATCAFSVAALLAPSAARYASASAEVSACPRATCTSSMPLGSWLESSSSSRTRPLMVVPAPNGPPSPAMGYQA